MKMSSKDSKGSSDSLPTKTKKKDKPKKGKTTDSLLVDLCLLKETDNTTIELLR